MPSGNSRQEDSLSNDSPSATDVCRFSRRTVLQTALAGGAAAALSSASPARAFANSDDASPVKPFPFEEASITDLQARMKSGEISAQSLTQAYLDRINEVDKSGPGLNSIIELNPDAIAIAESLDKKFKEFAKSDPDLAALRE